MSEMNIRYLGTTIENEKLLLTPKHVPYVPTAMSINPSDAISFAIDIDLSIATPDDTVLTIIAPGEWGQILSILLNPVGSNATPGVTFLGYVDDDVKALSLGADSPIDDVYNSSVLYLYSDGIMFHCLFGRNRGKVL